MVEQRWLVLDAWREGAEFIQTGIGAGKFRVLQYRVAKSWRAWDDVVSVDMRDYSPTIVIDWSEWQDVPVVREGEG